MVLRKIFIFAFSLLALQACERIPEWERQLKTKGSSHEFQRIVEMKRWLWTCRGLLSNYAAEGMSQILGQQIDRFDDYFLSKGLSSVDSSHRKTLLGTAFLWNEGGYLVSDLPAFRNVHDIECTNGSVPWLEARTQGVDSSIDLVVLKVEIASAFRITSDVKWAPRTGSLDSFEDYSILGAAYPGQVDRLKVTLAPFDATLNSGMNESLVLFLPAPPKVLSAGILVDSQARVIGKLLPIENALWGAAVKAERIDESVRAIMSKGKVLRPYLGLKIRYTAEGFVVQQLDVGSPAYEAGLRVQDILLKWNGSDLKKASDWKEPSNDEIGKRISLTYRRQSKVVESQLVVSAAE